MLEEQGITSALLDLGGNIQAIGSRPGGGDWRLGIRNPFGDGQVGMLTVSDCAVVTSGSYERYFVGEDGREYCHIIDPATGYPVDNGLVSMTIVTEEGKVADALSTSMFVKGLEGAEEYWREHQDFEMIAITKEGDVYVTEGLLKADIAYCLTGRSFVAVAGVNSLNGLESALRCMAQNGTKLVVEAYDMDKSENEYVADAAEKVQQIAHTAGLQSTSLVWNTAYKGIDDWQLALRQEETKEKAA